MKGGLDVMTPPFQLKPGLLRDCQNFECSIFGGYRRIAGYERYDGHARPSDQLYAVLTCSSITGGSVGNTLHGATSGATGIILAKTATQFILTKITGTFIAENLNVGAGTIGVSTGGTVTGGESNAKLNAQYIDLAADYYRTLISAIPGSGKVLGVWLYNDVVYGFRNNGGGTAAAMYASSASGWTAVSLGYELPFKTGSAVIAEGNTVVGGTSGASAVVTRVRLESGTWGAGTAAGGLIFASITGGPFQNGENLKVGGATKAVANGPSQAITLQPNGRYEFVNDNFTGSMATKRMYGCDGVNRAFEFDGTVFVPINTGMAVDKPTHIIGHLYHLFLSFYGSVQFSAAGDAYVWSPVVGAGEIAMGSAITGFAVQSGGTTAAALAVFTAGKLSILYGSGASTFSLVTFRDEIGSYPYTMQNIAQTIFLDLQGITDIVTTLNFGNFNYAVIANQVRSLINSLRATAIASAVSRNLGQYRLFFSGGQGVYLAMIGRTVIGVTPVLFPHPVRCACSDKYADGTEGLFFGDANGYVYQLDKGTSFDGNDIEAYIDLAYCFSGGARLLKGYADATLELSGSGYAEFNFGYSLGYGVTDVIQQQTQLVVSNFSSQAWDAAGVNWDSFTWDGRVLSPSVLEVNGEAENVSLSLRSVGDYFQPFTVTGAVIHYKPRREMR